MVGRTEPFDSLPLWLATSLPGFCALTVDAEGGDPPLAVEQGGRWFPYAVADDGSFAYLCTRPAGDDQSELGAYGYGPLAAPIVRNLAGQVVAWDREYRGGPGPQIAVWPVDTPMERLDRPDAVTAVVTKVHRRITISWPRPGGQAARLGMVSNKPSSLGHD